MQFSVMILLMVLVSGCAAYYGGDRYRDAVPRTDSRLVEQDGVTAPMFYGYGEGESRQEAENAAKADALFRAAAVMLEETVLLYGAAVQQVAAGFSDLDSCIISESMETVSWNRDHGRYQVIAGVRVGLDVLAGRIARAGIEGGMITDQVSGLRSPDEALPDASGDRPLSQVLFRPEVLWQEAGRPEFLVCPTGKTSLQADEAKAAAAAAEGVLVRYAFPAAINGDDRDCASLLSRGASGFIADYLVEVSAETSAEQGEIRVTLTCYEGYRGREIGSAGYRTDGSAHGGVHTGDSMRVLRFGAKEAMQELLEQISGKIVEEARSGDQYTLKFINVTGDQQVESLVSRLEQQTAALRRIAFAPGERRYVLVFDGSLEELEQQMFEAASAAPEFDHLRPVYRQGNTLIFDAGR